MHPLIRRIRTLVGRIADSTGSRTMDLTDYFCFRRRVAKKRHAHKKMLKNQC